VQLCIQSWVPHYLWKDVNPALASLAQIMSIKKQQIGGSIIPTTIYLHSRKTFKNSHIVSAQERQYKRHC